MRVTTLTLGGEGAEAGVEVPGRPKQVTHTLEGPRQQYEHEDDTGPSIRLSNDVEVCATRDSIRWRVIRVTAGAAKVTHPAELDIGGLSGPGWDGHHNLQIIETEEGFLLEDHAQEKRLHFRLEMGDENKMAFVIETEDQDKGDQLRGQFFRYDASRGTLVERATRRR